MRKRVRVFMVERLLSLVKRHNFIVVENAHGKAGVCNTPNLRWTFSVRERWLSLARCRRDQPPVSFIEHFQMNSLPMHSKDNIL
jgi:hypothetical protein